LETPDQQPQLPEWTRAWERGLVELLDDPQQRRLITRRRNRTCPDVSGDVEIRIVHPDLRALSEAGSEEHLTEPRRQALVHVGPDRVEPDGSAFVEEWTSVEEEQSGDVHRSSPNLDPEVHLNPAGSAGRGARQAPAEGSSQCLHGGPLPFGGRRATMVRRGHRQAARRPPVSGRSDGIRRESEGS
jgi:hypothetical protein